MKIAFIGTHGVGKATLCYDLAALLKRQGIDADIVKEVARLSPLPINRQTSLEAQTWILSKGDSATPGRGSCFLDSHQHSDAQLLRCEYSRLAPSSCSWRSRSSGYQVNVSLTGTGTGDTCKEGTSASWSKNCQSLPALGSELNALSAHS